MSDFAVIGMFLSTLSLMLAVVAIFVSGGIPVRLTLSPVEARVTVSSPAPSAEIKVMRIQERDLARFTCEYAMKRGYSIEHIVYDTDRGMITVKMAKRARQ